MAADRPGRSKTRHWHSKTSEKISGNFCGATITTSGRGLWVTSEDRQMDSQWSRRPVVGTTIKVLATNATPNEVNVGSRNDVRLEGAEIDVFDWRLL
jgi:hypothetical protein